MPKLNPGRKPFFGRGRYFVFLLTSVFFPFLLQAQPRINSFSPISGPIGTTVTITGSNFGATPTDNIVFFGAVKANVTSASVTSLTVAVPTGTTYEPITVTTGGLTASSSIPFNVIFSDNGQFTPQAFRTGTPVSTGGTSPTIISAKDFDGDGKIDLAVIIAQGLMVYNNIGRVGFPDVTAPSTPYSLPNLEYPQAMAAGDIDGDGKPDLLVASPADTNIYVFQNTSTPGNISFNSTPFAIPATGNIGYIALGDFNGDGKTDIATLDHISDYSDPNNPIYAHINVLANNSAPGNFSLGTGQSLQIVPGAYPMMLATADLDGDGMPELAYTEANYNEIYIFQNGSSRGGATISLSPATTPQPLITGVMDVNGNTPSPYGIAAGDMDGDGRIDLVAANMFTSNLGIFRNTSTPGNFSFSTESTTTPAPLYAAQVGLSDLDGDGLPDLSLVTQGADFPFSDSIWVYRNTSSSGHVSLAPKAGYLANSQAYWVAPADMDGDGVPDLPVVNNGAGSVSILINKRSTDLAITAFSPDTASSGKVVTITGISFTGVTGVSFGGVPAQYTVVSPTSIIATVGAGATGLVKVTTANAFATMPGFVFQNFPPTITSFSPQSAGTGTAVLIKGTGFISNQVNAVSFGGTPATSITVITDTTISAVVGPGSTGDVKVKSLGDSATAPGFTFTTASAGPPTITSFSPMSAMQGAEIVISGTNLSNITSVTFGGTPAQSFQIYGDNSIHAFVASGATGALAVTGTNGNASYPGFTFLTAPPPQNPPHITSFTPQSAGTGGTVTITGQYLKDIVSVTFGGSPAIINSQNDSAIVAIIGTGATGQVRVGGPAGADSLKGFIFVYDTTRTSPGGGSFQLVQFSGAITGNQPHLNWQTRNDGNISYYALERSVDGSQFNVIGTIPVSNKTGSNHNYTFTDLSPRNGINYYRLKMEDTTAHYSYGPTISLQLSNSTPLLVIYPNPVKYGFFLVDLPEATSTSTFLLTDLTGRIMKKAIVPPGQSQVRIDIPGLPRGTYQLRWTDGAKIAHQTILVL